MTRVIKSDPDFQPSAVKMECQTDELPAKKQKTTRKTDRPIDLSSRAHVTIKSTRLSVFQEHTSMSEAAMGKPAENCTKIDPRIQIVRITQLKDLGPFLDACTAENVGTGGKCSCGIGGDCSWWPRENGTADDGSCCRLYHNAEGGRRTLLSLDGLSLLSLNQAAGWLARLQEITSNCHYYECRDLCWGVGGQLTFEVTCDEQLIAQRRTNSKFCHGKKCTYHYGALMGAATSGNLKECQRLIDCGAPVNAWSLVDTGACPKPTSTALIQAAYYGHWDVVCCLLANGADVNQQCSDGWSPLMEAIWDHHDTKDVCDIAALLMWHRASPHVPPSCRWHLGSTPCLKALAADRDRPLIEELIWIWEADWHFVRSRFYNYPNHIQAKIRTASWNVSLVAKRSRFFSQGIESLDLEVVRSMVLDTIVLQEIMSAQFWKLFGLAQRTELTVFITSKMQAAYNQNRNQKC